MVKQFYTRTRPDTTHAWFHETPGGAERTAAVADLMTQNPNLVSEQFVTVNSELSETATVIYPDIESFREFLRLAATMDPDFKKDRARYFKEHGHSLLIEYQIEGMDERGLIANITPQGTTIRQADGTIITSV